MKHKRPNPEHRRRIIVERHRDDGLIIWTYCDGCEFIDADTTVTGAQQSWRYHLDRLAEEQRSPRSPLPPGRTAGGNEAVG